MSKYLLVADADAIQSFLFRSAHLREVAGASQLLLRLCREATGQVLKLTSLQAAPIQVIADGGKFQWIFEQEYDALRFEENLAEFYRRVTDSSLTCAQHELAEPLDAQVIVQSDSGEERQTNYQIAVEGAEAQLREAKSLKRGARADLEAPHWAICQDCGTRFAVRYAQRPNIPKATRLCQACLYKAEERDHDPGKYWETFVSDIGNHPQGYSGGLKLPWLDGRRSDKGQPAATQGQNLEGLKATRTPEPTDVVAEFDPLKYVGYLVADGNRMGELFSKSRTPEAAEKLSEWLNEVTRESLVQPMSDLARRLKERNRDRPSPYLPVYPLILGGDDVFALVPAPYAVDYAARFCQYFQKAMRDHLRDNSLFPFLEEKDMPTISAAVVICKGDYPYVLAHQRGEALLRKAKLLAKTVQSSPSMVTFDVILGNEILDEEGRGTKYSSPPYPQRPYWVRGSRSSRPVEDTLAIDVRTLIDQRFALRALPTSRLAELRALFDPANPPSTASEWKARWNYLRARIGRVEDHGLRLDAADKALGNPSGMPNFRLFKRENDDYRCHGLIDLIEIWDYALDLEQPWPRYEQRR